MGIPTVTIVTSEFTALAKDTAFSQGVAELSLVTVPHPMGMIPRPEIRRKADNAFAQILKSAIRWKPKAQLPPNEAPYPAARIKFKGPEEEVSAFFFDKGWSMGLPIIAPTSERVAKILRGTRRRPSEVIGIVPPRMGVLTVELVAVHAAMAGCRPAYMPVLIAALEALLAPEANWRGAGTTTGTTAMLVIINGPIVKEIGIASGQGAAGKGHQANSSIGYAMNSIAYAVGGSKPPSPDKGTLSAASDFTGWVFGENEDALPRGWAPFHVDRGFRRTDSVVTVLGTYPPVDNIDHWSVTPEEHIRWWAHLITPMINMGGPCSPGVMDLPNIIAMGPEHARTVAGAGWTKEKFAQAFWEQARIPLSVWPKGCSPKILEQKFGPVKRNTLIPITLKPELFYIVIAGGAGKHSHYFAPFPGCLPVSKKVSK